MSWPLIKIVDAPSMTANVLWDFNPGVRIAPGRWTVDESVGFPELLGDVDAIDPLYGPREIGFTQRIVDTKPNALAAQSALSRVLLRTDRAWLLWQFNALTKPIWFRTWRPVPDEMVLANVAADTVQDIWDIKVRIPAEPFAYGERVTQSAQTINNDPAHGTNPCRIVLTAFSGDAPTRLRIASTASAAVDQNVQWLWSLLSSPIQQTPMHVTIGTGDSFTATNDTAAASAIGSFSGGTGRVTNFATLPGMKERLTQTVSGITPGRYRMFVRALLIKNTTFQLSGSTSGIVGETVTLAYPGVDIVTWVDLGSFAIPKQADPDSTTTVSTLLTLSAGRTAGTGSLSWDSVLLVPEHSTQGRYTRTQRTWWAGTGLANGEVGTWDGDSEGFWSSTTASDPSLPGVFLTATPRNAHVLTLLQGVDAPYNGGAVDDTITKSASVVVSYYPRYLYVGDA